MSAEIDQVVLQQADWALRTSRPIRDDAKALARRGDALFVPLDLQTATQLESGAGGELNRLHSLRSSTALALNVFLPWKEDVSGIASALGRPGEYSEMAFERAYPTGVSDRHPHLDVVMEGESSRAIAVESKFLEIYDEPKKQVIQTSYTDASYLWEGLDQTRALAATMQADANSLSRLGSAQLIKHVLGLSRHYGARQFDLIYMWYELDGASAQRHRQELALFSDAITAEVNFTAITYQELFPKLKEAREPTPGYHDYLTARYFQSA